MNEIPAEQEIRIFVEKARIFARMAHAGQTYAGKEFVVHLDDVHNHLISVSQDKQQRAACYLHDTVEDGNVAIETIRTTFDTRTAEIVALCTDEPGKNRKERKRLTYARVRTSTDYGALLVKLCDRLGNVEKATHHGPPPLLKMYRDEHPSFKEAVYRDVHPNILIQQRIDKILSV